MALSDLGFRLKFRAKSHQELVAGRFDAISPPWKSGQARIAPPIALARWAYSFNSRGE